MSETPQNNPDYLQHHPNAVQDTNEAHQRAADRDHFETAAARNIAAVGLIDKALEINPYRPGDALREERKQAVAESSAPTGRQEIATIAEEAFNQELRKGLKILGRGTGGYDIDTPAARTAKNQLQTQAERSLELADKSEERQREYRQKSA